LNRIRQTSYSKIIIISVLIIAASVVFLNTLYNGFVYDDEFFILKNKWIRDFAFLPEIFSTHLWGFKLGSGSNYYRPLVHLVLMAEYHLFALTAWPYHLTNLLVHSANTVLVYLIALQLPDRKAYEPRPGEALAAGTVEDNKTGLIALGAGCLFAVHPVHVEAVAPASVVAELSLSFFYLASLYLYMRFTGAPAGPGRAALFAGSLLFSALGIFLKETAVTLIAVLFAYDLTAGGGLRLNAKSVLRCGFRYVPYMAIVLFYLLVRMHFLGGFVPLKQNAGMTTFQYFLNIPPLFAEYIRVLFYPEGLNVFYSFHPILSIRDYNFLVLLPLLLFIPIFIFLLIKYKRRALFCLFFAIFALSPALYLPGVGVRGNAFAERYLYIPSAGVAILVSALIYWFVMKLRTPELGRRRGTVFLAIIAIIAVVLSTGTILRNRVWESNYTLWKDSSTKTKDSKVVYINLGSAAGLAGHRSEAIDAYKKAFKIAPDSPEIYNNLGVEYLEAGELDEALVAFKKAFSLTSNPGTVAVIRKNLGDVYLGKGMLDDAIREYSEALRILPGNRFLELTLERVKRQKKLRGAR